jgi:hypothetical protein
MNAGYMLPIELWTAYWLASLVVLLLPLTAMWFLLVLFSTRPSDAGTNVTAFERRAARSPRMLRRIAGNSLPEADPVGPNHRRVEAQYGNPTRVAHEALNAMWSVPTFIAKTVLLIASLQAAWTLLTFLLTPWASWPWLAGCILALAMLLFVANELLKRRQWQRRAPFEWQFCASAARVVTTSAESGDKEIGAIQRVGHVERLLEDRRFDDSTGSGRLIRDEWAAATAWLSRGIASLELERRRDSTSCHEWIDAASAVVLSGRRSRRQMIADRISPRASPGERTSTSDSWRLILIVAAASGACLLAFAVARVTEGAASTISLDALPTWLEFGAAACTIATAFVVVTNWMARRARRAAL